MTTEPRTGRSPGTTPACRYAGRVSLEMRAQHSAGSMAGERLRLHWATAAGLEHVMGIGVGITLLVLGGIAAFGIRDQWSAIDLTAIGYICMAVGALAIILALVLNNQ